MHGKSKRFQALIVTCAALSLLAGAGAALARGGPRFREERPERGEMRIAEDLARESGTSVHEILRMRRRGEGWGEIARDLGVRLGPRAREEERWEREDRERDEHHRRDESDSEWEDHHRRREAPPERNYEGPAAAGVLGGAAGAGSAIAPGVGAGAAIGAAAGVLLDRHNRWRGAVLGGALGALLGGSMTEIAGRASEEAAQRNRPVTYTSQDGFQKVVATPVGSSARTRCHKVRERLYDHGKLIKDEVKEICESNKTEPTY